MSDYPRHPPKKLEQMRRRHEQHGSIRKTAEEYGMSKSHAHRLLQRRDEPDDDDVED
ncbi:MAG TPA: hypothetical protein VJQ82_08715 [Terriglobales bacterium]|nr:hypothetical protein [Terriglobales bacterium]